MRLLCKRNSSGYGGLAESVRIKAFVCRPVYAFFAGKEFAAGAGGVVRATVMKRNRTQQRVAVVCFQHLKSESISGASSAETKTAYPPSA